MINMVRNGSPKKIIPQFKLIIVFLLSLSLTLFIMCIGSHVIKYVTHQKMLAGAAASSREIDGAKNLVIMNGDSGYIGSSKVILKYIGEGYIKFIGRNDTPLGQWKTLSEFQLDAGTYTLSGLSVDDGSIKLRLARKTEDDVETIAIQYNDEVIFSIEKSTTVILQVRVSPGETIDTIARPAIYEDSTNE